MVEGRVGVPILGGWLRFAFSVSLVLRFFRTSDNDSCPVDELFLAFFANCVPFLSGVERFSALGSLFEYAVHCFRACQDFVFHFILLRAQGRAGVQ